MKKVAVVIPLYNHERYIGAAFASLRAQTRRPDRIIIIDDGSSDRSLAALLATPGVSDDPPGLAPIGDLESPESIRTRTEVILQENAGAHATLNRAIQMAQDCDYISILNSDDRYHPRRLERCLSYMESHPDMRLLCTRLRVIGEDGNTLPPETPQARWFSAAWSFSASSDESSKLDLVEWLGLSNFPGTTSNFFARADYLKDRPFSSYRFAHDYYLLIVAALEGQLAVLDAELLDYRVHGSNTIATSPENLIREMLLLNLDLARAVAPRLVVEPHLRAAYARYQRAAWSNFSSFRADLFNVLLTEALNLLPAPAVEALINLFTPEHFPEMTQFPNLSAVSAHHASISSLGPASSLADKFYALKAQLSASRNAARPWAEYRQLQTALLASRWFALGRLLGLTTRINRSGGKTPQEKVAILRERLAASGWLLWGEKLGIGSAQRLLSAARGAGPEALGEEFQRTPKEAA